MSQQYHGRAMDRPSPASGSVRRARERAEAGSRGNAMPAQGPQAPNSTTPSPPPVTSLATPPSKITKPRPTMDGKYGHAISRPTRVPQWPLPGPIAAPTNVGDAPTYRPPPGKPQQAPQRPPRPSRIPSMVDQSRLQEPTPSFLNPSTIPENPSSESGKGSQGGFGEDQDSSRNTSSSMGTIPDFPGVGTSRKNSTLGPPPSSRRGASSYYSHASFVSPIPEERSRIRSNGSLASSAAIPDGWGVASPVISPAYAEAFYDESTTDNRELANNEFGDEHRLVKSGSSGNKKAVAADALDNVVSRQPLNGIRPTSVFNQGNGYMDISANPSNPVPISKSTPAGKPGPTDWESTTTSDILKAHAAASSSDLPEVPKNTGSSRPFTRLSAIRRPPRLDIDAVRAAEARGSMTSLPDLIRRATQLASMIDKGRRPTSRMDELADFLNEKEINRDGAGHNRQASGLSDMLAAFPPPVHTPRGNDQGRSSWLRSDVWPAVGDPGYRSHSRASSRSLAERGKKTKRRCCGLPIWAFILLVFLVLCVVATAIVVPLEFVVFKNLPLGRKSNQSSDCQKSLPCQNGGTSVVSQGVCSCICTNGFTGSDCKSGGVTGCTTTNLVSTDDSASINNVTLGKAIPRLIADARANFSVPLSGTIILAKINSADLSCIAQNSMVTFDGQSTRVGQGSDEVKDFTPDVANAQESGGDITVPAPQSTNRAIDKRDSAAIESIDTPDIPMSATPASGAATPSSVTAPEATVTGVFAVTEEALDFARVAVLYILQEKGIDGAQTAQTSLQRFFSTASSGRTIKADQVTNGQAASVDAGNSIKLNLVDFNISLNGSSVTGKVVKRDDLFSSDENSLSQESTPCRVESYPLRH